MFRLTISVKYNIDWRLWKCEAEFYARVPYYVSLLLPQSSGSGNYQSSPSMKGGLRNCIMFIVSILWLDVFMSAVPTKYLFEFSVEAFSISSVLVHLRESHDSLPIFLLLASVIKYRSFTNFFSREVCLSIKTHFEEG